MAKRVGVDKWLFGVVLLLTLFGLVMVFFGLGPSWRNPSTAHPTTSCSRSLASPSPAWLRSPC